MKGEEFKINCDRSSANSLWDIFKKPCDIKCLNENRKFKKRI